MKIGSIIFARMSSSRLPGKALMEIEGRCLLGRVIDNAYSIGNVENVVVATSTEAEDDSITEFCAQERVSVSRGSLDNVAERAIQACRENGFDGFVRICGDRPFADIKTIERLVEEYLSGNFDVVTTKGDHPSVPGLTCEVVRTEALELLLPSFTPSDKEHVTSYFYDNPGSVKIKSIKPAYPKFPGEHVKLSVDSFEDISRVRWIIKTIDPLNQNTYSITDLFDAANSWKKQSASP